MGRHRQPEVRPRYGRIGVAATSVTVTAVAVLGGVGVLPSAAEPQRSSGAAISQVAGEVAPPRGPDPAPAPADGGSDAGATADDRREATSRTSGEAALPGTSPVDTALPADSGTGRRVVFSEGRQRVWLVGQDDEVLRSYLVSGSVYDNLEPGTYDVYSRSEQAWGIDDSGTMKYFVRFTQGENAAIGFHDIPVDDGRRVQTFDQLGTPQSHGCIRQKRSDARALWEFAPLGTTVVVTT